jgi:hypothetical protein
VIGINVGWLLVGDGVALALVEAVCVDGVRLVGFAEVHPATITRTLTSTSMTLIIADFSYHAVDLLARLRSKQAKTET